MSFSINGNKINHMFTIQKNIVCVNPAYSATGTIHYLTRSFFRIFRLKVMLQKNKIMSKKLCKIFYPVNITSSSTHKILTLLKFLKLLNVN